MSDSSKKGVNLGKLLEIVQLQELNNTYDMYFGSYPQSVKQNNVKIVKQIDDKYYLGDDKNLYVKLKTNNDLEYFEFLNKQQVRKNTEYYFKVEPILWDIYCEEDDTIFVASHYILDICKYDSKDNPYELSDIKMFLNEDFYEIAFSDTEKEQIMETVLGKVNLLCLKNLTSYKYGFNKSKYMNEPKRVKQLTDYALVKRHKRSGMDTENHTAYWLMDKFNDYMVYIVTILGCCDLKTYTFTDDVGIVPALKIKIK